MADISRSAVLLPLTAVAAILLALVTMECAGDGGDAAPVATLPDRDTAASPEWDEPPSTEPPERTEEPSVVEVHLDVSHPMAGFLPLPSRQDDLSTFQIVTQNVAQHMARVYGRAGGIEVRWRGIGHALGPLPQSPRLRPALFDGRSTRLDLSIASMLRDFLSGRAEAAALVTDLMATGERTGVTGPLSVANALGEWLRSEDVRSGVFHVGLLGVKAEYRGVTDAARCPPGPPLGCWYDERLPGFRRLDSVARIPFYVLVLGRGADSITSVLASLQRGAVELDPDAEVQWELLTRRSLGFDTALSCTAGEQYALFVEPRQQYRCVRDDRVTLSCGFENGFRPDAGRGTWNRTPADGPGDGRAPAGPEVGASAPVAAQLPSPIDLRVDGARLDVDLDCAPLRAFRSPDAVLALRLDVTGGVDELTADWRVRPWAQRSTGDGATDNAADWSDWSTELGVLGKTVHLDGFLQTVRIEPDGYRVELPAVLRFPGS
ncbi:MAG: hypothetical protein OXH75_12415 [Acidobacteria bacterium]|nr:hypothetical protein [Acidobacteriota bacterium]